MVELSFNSYECKKRKVREALPHIPHIKAPFIRNTLRNVELNENTEFLIDISYFISFSPTILIWFWASMLFLFGEILTINIQIFLNALPLKDNGSLTKDYILYYFICTSVFILLLSLLLYIVYLCLYMSSIRKDVS